MEVISFNTTLVQLKGYENCKESIHRVKFQYHTGPIKRLTVSWESMARELGFNTTLVQLKGPFKSVSQGTHYARFNTTLVQLKVYAVSRKELGDVRMFQYHTGPIKRKSLSASVRQRP